MSRSVQDWFGNEAINTVQPKQVVAYLSKWRDAGKSTMYNHLRSFLRDFFSAAIAEGLSDSNPVEHIKSERISVARSRLTFHEWVTICSEAEKLNDWARPCFELALLSGQRLSDIFSMKWADIFEDKIHITQKKTGSKVAIRTTNSLSLLGKNIQGVLDTLKTLPAKEGRVIPVTNQATITNTFAAARAATGISWLGSPPSFHEIRSLAARSYTDERGAAFAQRLLGHKSAQMTEKYIDNRGSNWTEV